MTLTLGERRGVFLDIADSASRERTSLSAEEGRHVESLDLLYRSLCAPGSESHGSRRQGPTEGR
jgi:hypothetical protein